MKFLVGIIFSFLVLIPSFAYAASTCPAPYQCSCEGTSYPNVDTAFGTQTDLTAAQSACSGACFDAKITGKWDISCQSNTVAQGDIADQSILTAKPTAKEYTVPNLSVPLPGLTFTPPYEKDGYVYVPYLGQYIDAVYKIAIALSSIGIVLTMMISGLRWMMARGDAGAVSAAKETISKGVVSLFILLGVVSITNLVAPELTRLDSLKILIIQPQELVLQKMIQEQVTKCDDVKGTVTACGVSEFKNPGNWDSKLVDAINKSANKYGADPIQMAAHIEIETGHNVNWGDKIGPCGEIGPSQFMPTTYEATTGDAMCCTAVSRKRGPDSQTTAACDGKSVSWPPPTSEIPHCRTDICGSCQVAASSCIKKFESPANIQHVTDTTAQYLVRLRSKTKDIALSMCAYNGSGEAAAKYARTAAGHYQTFCATSK